ncbi:MAG: hypothetical protein LAP40_13990 [Acidobacteriia bacterium]|nr:hypothetical protein [Terriglobia bacterium]
MRSVFSLLLLALLVDGATLPSLMQKPAQAAPAKVKDQYFTGLVMSIDEASLTVNRTVLGKNSSTKTFAITAETRFEGARPIVRSQVTVRYVTGDEGDRALRVILRRSPK